MVRKAITGSPDGSYFQGKLCQSLARVGTACLLTPETKRKVIWQKTKHQKQQHPRASWTWPQSKGPKWWTSNSWTPSARGNTSVAPSTNSRKKFLKKVLGLTA